jgi:uncharacterized membrane protein YciS (DUF1049 family)
VSCIQDRTTLTFALRKPYFIKQVINTSFQVIFFSVPFSSDYESSILLSVHFHFGFTKSSFIIGVFLIRKLCDI